VKSDFEFILIKTHKVEYLRKICKPSLACADRCHEPPFRRPEALFSRAITGRFSLQQQT
jgi:hypothetical protein